MAALKFSPNEFFQGRLTGWGMERTAFGRIVSRFSWTSSGEWSAEHKALHMDETYRFADGRELHLNWAIYADAKGDYAGVEGQRAAVMKGRPLGEDFELLFKQPKAAGAAGYAIVSRMRYSLIDAQTCMMWGPIRRMGGLPGDVRAVLRRESS